MNEIDKNNNTFFSATLCHVIIGVNRILIRLHRRMKKGGGQGSGRCVRGWVEGPPIILGGGGGPSNIAFGRPPTQ